MIGHAQYAVIGAGLRLMAAEQLAQTGAKCWSFDAEKRCPQVFVGRH